MSTERPDGSGSGPDAAARAGRAPQGVARRVPTNDGLLIIGLVGRAGSGKSTVARVLSECGARLIEADAIGHRVTDTDPEVRAAMIAEYGPDVYRADGALDRARVGARVFSDRGALQRLNRLVHPRIVVEMRREIAALATGGFRGPVVVDAALMLDWGFERECDAVIAVVAAEPLQIARLMAARGWTAEQARARLAAQRADPSFAAAADVVIDNSGDESLLRRRAAEALATLERARRG